jgi:hypothetical protein
MTAKKLLEEVVKATGVDIKELAIEQKGKSMLVRRYNEELEGAIIAKYNARNCTIEIVDNK